MTQKVNPYDHLPEKHLKRQLASVSRKMTSLAKRGKKSDTFEEQRILMLTISDSLTRKREVSWLEKLSETTPPAEEDSK